MYAALVGCLLDGGPGLPCLGYPSAAAKRSTAAAPYNDSAIDALDSDQIDVDVVESLAQAGSGALPLEELPSFAVAITALNIGVEELARRMRCGSIAVVGRIEHERLLLDVRTVADNEVDDIVYAIEMVLQ